MKILKTILKVLGSIVAAVVLIGVVVILILTFTEYKPKDKEAIEVSKPICGEVALDTELSVLTWNVGYCALGDNADFFMDGGTMVTSSSKERVQENMDAIYAQIHSLNPDIIFLQEVDSDSKRSYHLDETKFFADSAKDYSSSFAFNYKVLYVPYPWPPIGEVNCGVQTLSKFEVTEAERVSLPCPFGYPVRLANLKRCLLVSRIPVEGSDKELVVINLHLEAYDDGEGKEAQTKQLRELIEAEVAKGNYVIAGGDFNQAFSNVDTSKYPQVAEGLWMPGYIDVDTFKNETFYSDNSAPSCRSLDQPYEGADKANFQYYIIDGFIVSNNIEVTSVKTMDLGFKNSDHNPIQLKVKLQ